MKNFLQLLFFLSAHTPMLPGQRWVFHPTSSCPLHSHAGKTIGCLVVYPLSLKRGTVAPNTTDSGLCWCDMGHFLSPQSVGWSTGLDSLFTQLRHRLVGRKKDDLCHQSWGATSNTVCSPSVDIRANESVLCTTFLHMDCVHWTSSAPTGDCWLLESLWTASNTTNSLRSWVPSPRRSIILGRGPFPHA